MMSPVLTISTLEFVVATREEAFNPMSLIIRDRVRLWNFLEELSWGELSWEEQYGRFL
jgi:hypothetical protein